SIGAIIIATVGFGAAIPVMSAGRSRDKAVVPDESGTPEPERLDQTLARQRVEVCIEVLLDSPLQHQKPLSRIPECRSRFGTERQRRPRSPSPRTPVRQAGGV